jgi:cytochrome c-type biogenesis protein CcmH
MGLSIVFLVMTATAAMAVLWPLSRRRDAQGGSDLAVYRDQLAEIERDRARGTLLSTEAEAAHVEVARRLLAAAEIAKADHVSDLAGLRRRRKIVALVALIGVPLVSAGVYMAVGRPDLPDRPLAARLSEPPAAQGLPDLVARVESELQRRPEDGRGWDVIAPVYLRIGRPQDAATAYGNAIRLLGPSAEREAGLGEALVLAANGTVNAEAKAAFERALALQSGMPRARFYLARAEEQAGRSDAAADIYRDLIASAPEGAAWLDAAREALAETALGQEGRGPMVDAEALASATPEQRLATIRGMVEGLEERLNNAPRDLGGQLRLVRAWAMLGDASRAQSAARAARAAFEGDAGAVRRIDDLLLGLGLKDRPA